MLGRFKCVVEGAIIVETERAAKPVKSDVVRLRQWVLVVKNKTPAQGAGVISGEVEDSGIEPLTSSMPLKRSPS